MDAGEVERELEELEARIDRLRALYEQYFIGIERLTQNELVQIESDIHEAADAETAREADERPEAAGPR